MVTDLDPVRVLAENLNVEDWMRFKVPSLGPAGTFQQAVPETKSAMEIKLNQLRREQRFYKGRPTDIEIMTYDASREYWELCLGIHFGEDRIKAENLSCKLLYDGWYSAKRNHRQKAIEYFGNALEVMAAQMENQIPPTG